MPLYLLTHHFLFHGEIVADEKEAAADQGRFKAY